MTESRRDGGERARRGERGREHLGRKQQQFESFGTVSKETLRTLCLLLILLVTPSAGGAPRVEVSADHLEAAHHSPQKILDCNYDSFT